ncbi:MAG: hypothetical protein B6241_09055 [Spirochaetaceae bacterium 4572_59]|nr:MAG: hypothetical protein B6241_09055 [Spirochaetaceae bacterium 4572_59]
MIVKMSKVSFIFLDSEKDTALEKIQKAGVVHLQRTPGSSETLTGLAADRNRIVRALSRLDVKAVQEEYSYSEDKARDLSQKVLDVLDSIKESEEKLNLVKEDLIWWEPWGDFDPSEIAILKSRGVELHFYEVTRNDWEDIFKDYRSFVVSSVKNTVYGIIVVAEGEEAPDLDSVKLPEYSVSELLKQKLHIENKLKGLYEVLQQFSGQQNMLKALLKSVEQDIEYHEVRTGLGNEDNLDYFTGFMPERDKDKIQSLAAENAWAVILSEPTEGDVVPSLVENNKLVNTIKPLFDILEVLPGYKEMDISLDFLISFTLFFAMIIGDAGYGVLFLLLTILVRFKSKKGGPGFNLMYLLSSGTILWGMLTGNWFGSLALGSWEPLKGLVIPQISAFPELFGTDVDSSSTIKYMCFVIATIQLSIARFKNFVFKMPSLVAFEQLGWLTMLLGIYHVVLFLVLGISPIPPYAMNMIAVGLVVIILFSQQEKGVNFFKGVLKGLNPIGLFQLFLDSISLLSDIISYIRLFAVGLASLAIAVSFNAMAAPMMAEPGVAMIGGALILLLGHSLNIVMGALSLIVHGVRLNMLEYSGHLDMEWSGFKYEPFKKVQE